MMATWKITDAETTHLILPPGVSLNDALAVLGIDRDTVEAELVELG